MKRTMTKRVLLGLAMIVGFSGLFYLDWWLEERFGPTPLRYLPTTAGLLGLIVAGFFEFARLARACGTSLLGISGLIASAATATVPYWHRHFWPLPYRAGGYFGQPTTILLAVSVLAVFAEQMIRYRNNDALRRIAVTLLAVLYLGLCGALILLIRRAGVPMLALFLIAVKFTDIGAYLVGSAIGRQKLIAWLSPGKSWEGLVGGLAVSVGVTMLAAAAMQAYLAMGLWKVAIFAVVVGLAGQFADLCESLLKRSARMKDSGSVVPEFGGVLDILDSLLLAAPVGVIMIQILT